MKPQSFIDRLEKKEIVAAIGQAEAKSSGEIRVFISKIPIPDPVAEAKARFAALGMQATRERNGVLIFVAPASQNFAVVGDEAVHAKCGDSFWTDVAQAMQGHFKTSQFTAGIIHGIAKAGHLLATHFPRSPDDKNELSDEIEHD